MREHELLSLVRNLHEASDHPEVKAVIYDPPTDRIGAVALRFTSGATGYIKSFKPDAGVQR